jgi:Subtilisin inhibitor-like
MRLVLLLPLLVLAACAQPSGGGAGAQPSTSPPGTGSSSASAPNDLRITIDRGDGREPEQYTLVCGDRPVGTLPDPQAACAHLARLPDPFAPIPADAMCAQVHGGPQTARVTGTWGGRPVDLELSRVDGCRISQWDALGPLLPGPAGAEPTR